MARTLEGNVALVTGASSGIGAEAARALARRGCRLALLARRLERLDALRREISESMPEAEVLVAAVDVTDPVQVEAAVGKVLERFGAIDLVFNNAGMGRMDWLEKLDRQRDVADQLAANLLGAVYVTQAVLPSMLARRRGHIINMGSIASYIGTPKYSIYAAGKFGLRGFSEALRREVAGRGIRVSVVYPGGVRTDFGRGAGGGQPRRARTPSWLALTPSAVGEAVARLALRPRRSLVLPAFLRPVIWANVLFPGLSDRLIAAVLERRQEAPAPGEGRSTGGRSSG